MVIVFDVYLLNFATFLYFKQFFSIFGFVYIKNSKCDSYFNTKKNVYAITLFFSKANKKKKTKLMMIAAGRNVQLNFSWIQCINCVKFLSNSKSALKATTLLLTNFVYLSQNKLDYCA